LNVVDWYKDYTDPIPDDLVTALRERKCVALLGSGVTSRCLSKSRAPLPGWAALLRSLVEWADRERIVNRGDVEDLVELIESSKFLIVAQELREQIGDAGFSRFMSETFDPDAIVPSPVHELLSVVPFRGFITTNYDNLLERAYINVKNRQLERLLLESETSFEKVVQREPFLLKLHGDIEVPSSIVLAYRDYLKLVADTRFQTLLDTIFSEFSTLMVGYGLNDLDIIQSLDRTTHAGTCRRHFLLTRKDTRNSVERRRLLRDRNIETIQYIDYFGFHNHVDTFLEALVGALDLASELKRVRPKLRRRIHVHYPLHCVSDGEFAWHYVFREGAITLSERAQLMQLENLKSSLDKGLRALDYIAFVTDEQGLTDATFRPLIERTMELSKSVGVQVVFLIIGSDQRPDRVLPAAAGSPAFYLRTGFGEIDLEAFRAYIAQDMQAGFRQP
jgi:hypothetical protein